MISCIFSSLLISLISALIAGLPTFVFLIMLESAGLMDYVLAFNLLCISVIELIKFIFVMISDTNMDLSFKSIFSSIKSIFKKKDKNKNNTKKKIKMTNKIKIFEIVLVLVFAIIGIFYKPHSIVLDLIYDNIIVRILYMICIPLIICDIINNIRDGIIDGIGEFISEVFLIIVVPSLLAIIFSSSFIVNAKMFHEDILENQIKPLFIYDNQEYDELRMSEDFKGEFEYLKDTLNSELEELKQKHDIKAKNGYDAIRRDLVLESNITEYGYKISDKEWSEDGTIIISVVDLKTREFNIYKFNINNNIFEKSSVEEFEELRKTNLNNNN